MRMADFEMTKISDDYKSLSGNCTIRKVNDKYVEMMPGDLVEVSHKKDADDVSDLAVEYLTVKAMATASLRELVHAHKWSLVLPMRLDKDFDRNSEEVEDYIASFYDDDKSGDFIVIYFN